MFRIGIIGPESTGKTTLARQLAAAVGGCAVMEYAREYVEQLGRPYSYEDVVLIAREQIRQLDAYSPALSSKTTGNAEPDSSLGEKSEEKFVFFDTELIVTKVWFKHKYGECPAFVTKYLEQSPLDFYLLCSPDLPFVADPVRENPHIRQQLFDLYLDNIRHYQVPYAVVSGSGEARLRSALAAVGKLTAEES